MPIRWIPKCRDKSKRKIGITEYEIIRKRQSALTLVWGFLEACKRGTLAIIDTIIIYHRYINNVKDEDFIF